VIDPLSQVLGSVRLTGGVFLEARFTAPWCTTSHVTPDDIRAFIETPGQIIAYHFVIDGRLQCACAGEPPMEVASAEHRPDRPCRRWRRVRGDVQSRLQA
jgi:hypothetical protein